jgi:predicted P-loop ATPase
MNYVTQPVETGDQTSDAISPALEFGEVIDLHPVYSAMAKARETAEANGAEPEAVVWDPAWPYLEVDDDSYWSDLVERNWETLSRWYAMSLKAGQKDKRLHFKVVEGVETASAVDAASTSATKPAINKPVDDAPLPNCEMIRSHVEMLHALAKDAHVDGILTFTRIDSKDNLFTERFSIGDVDNHANAVIGWSTHPGLNLYIPWAIFRKDLPRVSRGNEEHVVVALAFVGDLDADTGKAGTGLDGLPVESPYVMETSEGNFQPIFPLARALNQVEAKPIAVALSDAIGADNRTKDTSGLWRIPGTLNWPTKKKLERGRSPVPQLVKPRLNWTGELVEPEALQVVVKDFQPNRSVISSVKVTPEYIDWTKVDEHSGWLKGVESLPQNFNLKGRMIVAHTSNIKDLNFDLEQASVVTKPYQSWSDVSIALAAILKNHGGFTNEQIAAGLMCDLACNQHVTKIPRESDRRRSVERSIARSHAPTQEKAKRDEGEPEWRERRNNGSPVPSMHNARLAITSLGIVCSQDLFHNRTLVGYAGEEMKHALSSVIGEVNDAAIIALRQLMSDRFGFDLKNEATRDAVQSLALEHCFNPVCDLIDKAEVEWDGVKRLDRMAADYLNCEDTPLNSAFMRKALIAMVKRAREPGCKFDTIIVLESGEGFNKSTAWRVLAGDENFSDEKIIGKEGREVQEQLSGIWIHENADLAGMRKTDVESVKAYASRTTDIARAAFGHFVTRQPRHSIEVGTTNADTYLQSQTGNRRFWPMTVIKSIDIDKLQRDRLQIIGEAARLQTAGESVVLDEALWGDAGKEQEKRRIPDPWEDTLREIHQYTLKKYLSSAGQWVEKQVQILYYDNVGHDEAGMELVTSADLLEHVLGVPIAQQTATHTMRLANVMKHLGWQRHSNGQVTVNGKRQKGYFRPERKPSEAPRF